MNSYSVSDLCESGPRFAMAMLLDCLNSGEPFVTYGAIRDELEYQLKIEAIFPTHIGAVAGSLMDQILNIDPKAPLINALITRPNGVPGTGVGGYFAKRYQRPAYKRWSAVALTKKRQLVDEEREKVLRYRKWHQINARLFGASGKALLRKKEGTEVDGSPRTGRVSGSGGESEEHKNLKAWVAENPGKLGLARSFGKGGSRCHWCRET